jgi:hypothetical protein
MTEELMSEALETFGFDMSKGMRPSRELEAWCEDKLTDAEGVRLKYVFKAVFRRFENGEMNVTVHAYLPIDGLRRMVTIRDGEGREHRGVALAEPRVIPLTELPPEEIR